MTRSNPYSRQDSRTLAARGKGYPARSVFKLEEIDAKLRLLAAGQSVVDLGAAPGSWSLFAAQKIGPQGRLLSIDLKEMEQVFPSHVTVCQGDALDLQSSLHRQHGPYDLVLSDMAPNTGGDKAQNAARSYNLFMAALGVAKAFGKPGSAFVGKLFMGGDFEDAKRSVAESFQRCKLIKPKGTRGSSVEIFVAGVGLRAADNSQEE